MLALFLVSLLAQMAPPSFSAGVEASRESLRYRFDNPSRFDTPENVPHFFEQTYDTDAPWIAARVTARFFSMRARSEAAFTPSRTSRADDFDTFFQPDGNVIVTGTTGHASLVSWCVSEQLEAGRWRRARFGIGYAYRRDRARFHDGEGITTTSRPATVTRRLVTTRETTVSNLHAISWFGETSTRLGIHATLESSVQVSPVSLARLTVDLPDKYPGRTLAFDAKVAVVQAQTIYWYARAGWALGIGGGMRRSFSWQRGSRLDLRGAFADVELRRRIP